MGLKVRVLVVTFFAWAVFCVGIAKGDMPCPPMPAAVTTIAHDVKSDIDASVGSLGKLKVGQIGAKTDVVAKSIFEKYSNLDRLLALQTMAATYCALLRESKLSDIEKLDRWDAFQTKVLDMKEHADSEGKKIPVKPAVGAAASVDERRRLQQKGLAPLPGHLVPNAVWQDGVIHECVVCPRLISLPRGAFNMGNAVLPTEFHRSATPVHRVTIDYRLAVGVGEVSVKEFQAFVAETGYQTDAEKEKAGGCMSSSENGKGIFPDRSWRNPGFKQQDTEPATCLSWNDAQSFVTWLNIVSKKGGYRLLSEAEWEYAARAGQGDAEFPWGSDPDFHLVCSYANVGDLSKSEGVPRFRAEGARWTNCRTGFAYTAPEDASEIRSDAFGLRHVLGNVCEWIEDPWHDDYIGAPADGSVWGKASDSPSRICRGGSWANHPVFADSAYRARYPDSTYRDESTGFRVGKRLN
jgi:formylglycine-generating enzyme required for sulfatase activity